MDSTSREQEFLEECRKQVTRRWFFRECGVGLGAIALSELMGASARAGNVPDDPLAPEGRALRPESKARHLSVHGRRTKPPGAF